MTDGFVQLLSFGGALQSPRRVFSCRTPRTEGMERENIHPRFNLERIKAYCVIAPAFTPTRKVRRTPLHPQIFHVGPCCLLQGEQARDVIEGQRIPKVSLSLPILKF